MARLSVLLLALIAPSVPPKVVDQSQAAWKHAAATDELSLLLGTLNGAGKPGRTPIHELMGTLNQELQDHKTATPTANRILERRDEYDLGRAVEQRLFAMIGERKEVAAAELWLQCLKAKLVAKTLAEGGVAIGRVVVEDGRLEPEMVLAQMPILPDGSFAGEIGSFSKPIRFRAVGYEEIEIPLSGHAGDVVDVGTVTLKPIPAEKAATLTGRVALDIPERAPAAMSISLQVPKTNMPYIGFSPRRRWPDPLPIAVDADGVFRATGLSPGEYFVQINAKDHAPYTRALIERRRALPLP